MIFFSMKIRHSKLHCVINGKTFVLFLCNEILKTEFPQLNHTDKSQLSVSCGGTITGYRLHDITDVHIMARLQEDSKFEAPPLRITYMLTEAVL